MPVPARLSRTRLLPALAAAVLAAGCTSAPEPVLEAGVDPAPTTTTTPPAVQPRPAPVALATDAPRRSAGVAAAGTNGAPYNYGPTVLAENGRYRMWWCSQLGSAPPPGDDILLAETADLATPFRGADGTGGVAVFSGSATGFDGMHTCDPSVLRVGGTYYLYYTGAAGDHALGNSIGLATSPDGVTWTRANGGRPIVTSAMDLVRDNAYGAGQPAAVFLDGWFYLVFTDTTAQAAGWNGAGQFLLRSTDPAFQSRVEVLTERGFEPGPVDGPRTRALLDAFSVDLVWIDALAAFAVAHQTDGGTTLTFWDRGFASQPYRPVLVPGPWAEGPGVVRDRLGHLPPSLTDPCERVPVDLVRATRVESAPTDLVHFGLDLVGTGACSDPERVGAALEGFAVPSPSRTVDLVSGGVVVRLERRSVAEAVAHRVLDERVPAVDALTVAGELVPGAPAVTTGTSTGFLIDGRLWPVGNAEAVARNGSEAARVTHRQWADYPLFPG